MHGVHDLRYFVFLPSIRKKIANLMRTFIRKWNRSKGGYQNCSVSKGSKLQPLMTLVDPGCQF